MFKYTLMRLGSQGWHHGRAADFGTFINPPEGAIGIVNGNNFQASDWNDLTLTSCRNTGFQPLR